ncbi:MAG: Eco57I restriction-modification methylase domain-containing protein [Bacteroidia bacterium]|nr:Eco57I restriction-modification methylase domain-containing protein [Bacteroidia bacterium]MCF8427165.1 Eco57I restriction-modification methylase domain-containing protein [Bacteroidia bacterium]MCF8445810.1 Eco57I restriction-modification methylase domain-containing protein [Bacteroidia bacterium]
MSEYFTFFPQPNELPSKLSERLGLEYSKYTSSEHKKNLGQFFTPSEIASLMASMALRDSEIIRILDPGAGTGILSTMLIESIVVKSQNVRRIELVAYEADLFLAFELRKVYNYLSDWLVQKNIEFEFEVRSNDFIIENSLRVKSKLFKENYDIIISNPPYFKISKSSPYNLAVGSFLSTQSNIYSVFMAICSKLLLPGGTMVFITPRSFAAGSYFKSFRNYLFSNVSLRSIHLFDSRKEFGKDNVLQETIILNLVNDQYDGLVSVSNSRGLPDGPLLEFKYLPLIDLIDLNSEEKFLYVPTSSKEEEILRLVRSWPNKLRDYNISISTGPVVSFRCLDIIKQEKKQIKNFAPLFWLQNVGQMDINWPLNLENKGQYIETLQASKSVLLPNKNCIFLRRFSAKGDSNRLISSPYFSSMVQSEFIGVENKLNYIYRKDGNMTNEEIVGLSAILNSKIFNDYFQIFNGNVNVSATELREMNFPPLKVITSIGIMVIKLGGKNMDEINQIVQKQLNSQSQIISHGQIRRSEVVVT